MGTGKETHVSASSIQGFLLREDLPDSRTFHSVMMLSPFFLNTAGSCPGLFSQRLIAFLGDKTDYRI